MMETVDLIVIIGLTHLSLSSVQALAYLLFSHSKFFNLMGSNFVAEQALRIFVGDSDFANFAHAMTTPHGAHIVSTGGI